jgi:CHAT domain-containing protein
VEVPFDAALPLNASQISIKDLLFLTSAPRFVTLSACAAGHALGDDTEGIGLAHAFLAAGSQSVIAPSRDVRDTLAARLAEHLYSEDFAVDPAAALRRAQLALRRLSPGEDWAAFRAWVP